MPLYNPASGSGAPIDATYLTQTANGTLTAEQALGALATGLLKNTTTTGVQSIGVAGTDYPGLAFANVFTALQTITLTGSSFQQLVKIVDDTAGAKPYITIKGPEGEFNIGNWEDVGRFWHSGGSVDSFAILEDGRLVIGPGLTSFVRIAQFNNQVVGSKPYIEITSEAGTLDAGAWGNKGRLWMSGSDPDSDAIHIDATGNLGVGASSTILAKAHFDQVSTTFAKPTIYLTQADLSEEFIEFNGTVATGNPIEAVGAKTLTTTHFIRVSVNGSFLYIPVGTIA